MKIILIVCLFCVLILIIVSAITLSPPQIRGQHLNIQILETNSSFVGDSRPGNSEQHLFINVSNVSRDIIGYDVAHKVSLIYFENGVWKTNPVGGHFFTEEVLLGPGALHKIEDYDPVPPDASAVRAEIFYISPTWRGRIARKISSDNFFYSSVNYVWEKDISRRTETECSPIYYLKKGS